MLSHISFLSLPAVDLERARDFYVQKLGMAVHTDAPYGESRWIMLTMSDARTRLHFDKVDQIGPQNVPALPIVTEDIESFVKEIEAKGVEIVTQPSAAEWDPTTIYALIKDSEGNLVLLTNK